MNQCIDNGNSNATQSARAGVTPEPVAFIGLDVHKDTIAVAIAESGREQPWYECEIAHTRKQLERLVKRLSERYQGQVLEFVYEAGPCGYGLYRFLLERGHQAHVVAPSRIAREPGERIKTDRRDALKLARLARSGDLHPVWVPGPEQEAMRDVTRARDDMKSQQHKARQQLNGFVLRHGHHWPSGRTRWTKAHYRWLESLKFEHDWQQLVLHEYIDAVRAATERVAEMSRQLERLLPHWSLAPVIEALVALRGIDKLSAMVLVAELGDISRFDSPRQLMAFLGLVPSEHSTGNRRRQGGITGTGNKHARRVAIESAWCYRFPPRQSAYLRRKSANAPDYAKKIGWKAQKRLCGRYQKLTQSGKNTKLVCVAVARELIGFIWDIACHTMPEIHDQQTN